jgi:diguanylate cyclase (GGDEF)-like protein
MGLSQSFADAEVSFALVAGLYALLAVTGGLESPLYPLLYAVVAFTVTFQTRAAASLTLLAVLALEAATWWRTGHEPGPLRVAVLHAVFVVLAAFVHALFLRGLVAAHRRAHGARVEEEVARQKDSARDYRLISVALGAESREPRHRRDEEMILQAGAVETISSSIYNTLDLLRRALDARTCALLWVDARSGGLKVKELVSVSDEVVETSQLPLAGLVKAVVRDRKPLSLASTKPGQLVYYPKKFSAGAFVGVPALDGRHLRGVVCADRDAPFEERDIELVSGAATQVLDAIRSEQVFSAVERSKYEHERFYHASSMLCRALTLDQVMETAFDAAKAIVDYDVGVITLYDAERRRHRVQSVRESEGAQQVVDLRALRELEFRDNSGLASMVVKNKHHLPASGALRDNTTPVFTRKARFSGESLLVLPLLSADEAIGTFTLAAKRKGQFRKDTREMLGVISNQVAVSLQNALMYKKMETMATTDGLTGLTNHRTFQERFRNLVERSERHGHKAAMLLCDVDHFKSVNDTYGHPIGDEVLRRVARVLQEAVRKIDIPARYGGEEFAVVLEATDLDGALGLAERIRLDVSKLVIESDKGPFQVTMSIGVAAYPADGTDPPTLIEHADMALYHAKQTGRNRVVCYRDFQAARDKRRAS